MKIHIAWDRTIYGQHVKTNTLCGRKLDRVTPGLLNAVNVKKQRGALVVEPMCIGKVTQKDAIAVCRGWKQKITIPRVGDRVKVTGLHVLDTQHGHLELHPISLIEILK